MLLEYLAHSCFLGSGSSASVIIDPYGSDTGYALPMRKADCVLVTHGHKDHCELQGVNGAALVISGAGRHKCGELEFSGILAHHDSCAGKLYGAVTLYSFVMDDIRFCHLSDLGCTLNPAQLEALGTPDVIFLPVGGTFTLDAAGAYEVMTRLRPKITIPMHYHTAVLNRGLYPLESRDKFLSLCPKVKIIRDSVITLTRDRLPGSPEVWALNSTF